MYNNKASLDCNCFHVACNAWKCHLEQKHFILFNVSMRFPMQIWVQFKANPRLPNMAWTYCGQYYVLSSEKAWWKSRSRTTDWWGSSHRFPSAPWKRFYQTVHRRSDSDRQHFGSQPGRLMKRFVRWQRQRNNIWCASDSPQCVLVRFQGDFCKWGLTENFSILK